MKIPFATLALCFPVFANAAHARSTYLVSADIYENNALVSSPKIVTLDSSPAEISQSNQTKSDVLALKVIPKAVSKDKTDPRIALKVIFKNLHDGAVVSGSKDFVVHKGEDQVLSFTTLDGSRSDDVHIRLTDYKQ